MTQTPFERYLRPGAVTNLRQTETGLIAHLGAEQLSIDVVTDNLLRIKISRGGRFENQPSVAVDFDPIAKAKSEGKSGRFDLTVSASEAVLSTANLIATIQLAQYDLRITRTDGSPVLRTYSDAQGSAGYATLNDAFYFKRQAEPTDAFFGLGEKTGMHNRRGRDFTLWNTDVLNPTASGEFTSAHEASDPRADNTSVEFDPYYVSIPLLYQLDQATKTAAASFVDNPYRGYYDLRPTDHITVKFAGGQYTEYVFGGPTIEAILADYSWLTGRIPLPPLWALGYHYCRWHAYEQQQVAEVVAKHRELHIPLETFWLDIDHMDGYRVFTWDRERFPDPHALLGWLHEQGVRAITIVDPGVKIDPNYEVYQSGLQRDVFARTEGGDIYVGQVWPGNTAFPDFATERARQWWGELNAKWVQAGLSGIWNDMNEPATGDIDPLPMRFDGGSQSHQRFHNEYATLMAMATVEGLKTAMPDQRTFVLSRAGSPGIQRYAANWMGDNLSRWDHLKLAITMGNGLSLSGQPFVGADIGGFAGNTDAELLTRWMQLGTLTPFARNHNHAGGVDQYPWAFGSEHLDSMREAIALRYRLLPYLYSAFAQSSATGSPIQAPLAYEYQGDLVAWQIEDQFLLGADLLVAPVIEAGSRERRVYLPEGAWYHWFSRKRYEPGWHTIAAPLNQIPLFVRAGAIIPMLAEAPDSTMGLNPQSIDLLLFPLDEGRRSRTATLLEDDGITTSTESSGSVTTKFYREGDNLHIESSGTPHSGWARDRFRIINASTGELQTVSHRLGKIALALAS